MKITSILTILKINHLRRRSPEIPHECPKTGTGVVQITYHSPYIAHTSAHANQIHEIIIKTIYDFGFTI